MFNIDWPTIIGKVPEIVGCLIVAWFALKLTSMNQSFILEQQDRQNGVLDKLADRMDTVAEKLAELTTIITAHDARSRR